jgi:hypothetical protein
MVCVGHLILMVGRAPRESLRALCLLVLCAPAVILGRRAFANKQIRSVITRFMVHARLAHLCAPGSDIPSPHTAILDAMRPADRSDPRFNTYYV